MKRLEGSAQSPIDPDLHICRFAGRCARETDICRRAAPPLLTVADGHLAACHRAGETGVETVTRILLLNPNTSVELTDIMAEVARASAGPGVVIEAITAPRGVPYIATRAARP